MNHRRKHGFPERHGVASPRPLSVNRAIHALTAPLVTRSLSARKLPSSPGSASFSSPGLSGPSDAKIGKPIGDTSLWVANYDGTITRIDLSWGIPPTDLFGGRWALDARILTASTN